MRVAELDVLIDIRTLLVGIQQQSQAILDDLVAVNPQGRVYPIVTNLTVVSQLVQVDFTPSLMFGVTLINDGPGTVEYEVPYGTGARVQLNFAETHTFMFLKPVIGTVGLRLTAGATASIRCIGLY